MIVVYFNKLGHAKVFEHGHLREITLSVQGCPCELAPLTGLFFFSVYAPYKWWSLIHENGYTLEMGNTPSIPVIC